MRKMERKISRATNEQPERREQSVGVEGQSLVASKLRFFSNLNELAERGGFEPPVQLLTVQRFRKPPPSATRPPLRIRRVNRPLNYGSLDYISQRRCAGVKLHHPSRKHSNQKHCAAC